MIARPPKIEIPVFNIEVIDHKNEKHFIEGTGFEIYDESTCVIFIKNSPQAVFKDPVMVKKHETDQRISMI